MAYPTDVVLPLSPRHYWRMGAASGAETDLGSGATNLTVTGGTRDVSSPWLGADDDGQITFDGVDDSASAALSLQAATTITIAGEITVGSYSTDDRMGFEYSANPNANAGISLDIGNSTGGESGTISVRVTGAGGSGASRHTFLQSLLPVGEQHHLALVLGTSGSILVYIDGVQVSTTLRDGGTPGGTFADTTLYLASRAGASLWCPVSWDELCVFTTGLVADDIAALALVTPPGPATLYVDADHPDADDAGDRDAAQDPDTPLATIGRAIELVLDDDIIDVAIADTTYAAFEAIPDNTTAARVTVRGAMPDADRPSVARWTLQDLDSWVLEDLIADGNSASPPAQNRCNAIAYSRVWFKTGGLNVADFTGETVLEDCEIEAPFDDAQPGEFLNGVGIRLTATFSAPDFNAEDFTLRRCDLHNIGGEDALQLVLGLGSHSGTVLVDECHFHDIKQQGIAHTDGIQSTGMNRLLVHRTEFDDVDSMIICSDDFTEYVELIRNKFAGSSTSGFSTQFSGVRSAFFDGNTWGDGRFADLRFYVNGNAVADPDYTLVNNIIPIYLRDDSHTPGNDTRHEGNLIGAGPITDDDFRGYAEFGTSPDTDYELANSGITSPGIDQGVIDPSLSQTDRLGRTIKGSAPDIGCHESDPSVLVTPRARGPILISTTPADGATGVDTGVSPEIVLFPKPGKQLANVNASTVPLEDLDGDPVPIAVTVGAPDENGHQTVTIDPKYTLDPPTEGTLYPLSPYTVRILDAIEDTEGTPYVGSEITFSTVKTASEAIYPGAGGISSFTISPDPRFPVGMDLGLWETTGDGRAKGPFVTSATVGADSRATFSGLRTGVYYVAGPSLAGPFTFFRIYG